MSRRAFPTTKQGHRPVVLVIGGTSRLADRCAQAVSGGLAGIVECDLASASTQAALWRPFAFVVLEELHAFDPTEFEALARDVGARLIVVPNDDTHVDGLASDLRAAAADAKHAMLSPL